LFGSIPPRPFPWLFLLIGLFIGFLVPFYWQDLFSLTGRGPKHLCFSRVIGKNCFVGAHQGWLLDPFPKELGPLLGLLALCLLVPKPKNQKGYFGIKPVKPQRRLV